MTPVIVFGLITMLHVSSAYIYLKNFLLSQKVRSKILFLLATLFEIGFIIVFFRSLYLASIFDWRATTLLDYPLAFISLLIITSVTTFAAGMMALEKKILKLKKLGLPVVFASLAEAVLFTFMSLALLNRY